MFHILIMCSSVGSLLDWFQLVLELLMNKSTTDLLIKILIVFKNSTSSRLPWKALPLLNGDKEVIDWTTEGSWGGMGRDEREETFW